jgi:hypothetical protein
MSMLRIYFPDQDALDQFPAHPLYLGMNLSLYVSETKKLYKRIPVESPPGPASLPRIVLTAPGELCSGFTSTAVLGRFNGNGAIEASFGADGQITFALAIEGQSVVAVSPGSVLVDPDGRIVLTAQEQ